MVENNIVFDADVLRITSENDRKWAEELLEMFRVDTAQRINAVKLILKGEQPDANTLRIHFHTIKSSAGSIGAVSLSENASMLENASRNSNIELILSSVDSFEDIYRQSVAEFKKTIERMF